MQWMRIVAEEEQEGMSEGMTTNGVVRLKHITSYILHSNITDANIQVVTYFYF